MVLAAPSSSTTSPAERTGSESRGAASAIFSNALDVHPMLRCAAAGTQWLPLRSGRVQSYDRSPAHTGSAAGFLPSQDSPPNSACGSISWTRRVHGESPVWQLPTSTNRREPGSAQRETAPAQRYRDLARGRGVCQRNSSLVCDGNGDCVALQFVESQRRRCFHTEWASRLLPGSWQKSRFAVIAGQSN